MHNQQIPPADSGQPDPANQPEKHASCAAATFQKIWGRVVLDQYNWQGNEVVLDAGCGAGRLFPDLLARIPAGRLYAVDASPGMLHLARQRAGQLAPPVPIQFLEGSITDLQLCAEQNRQPCLPEPVDLVVSVAVFHWVPDKLRLFSTLIRLMRPEARLLAQYGGEKHLRHIRAAAYRAAHKLGLEKEVGDWLGTFHFIPVADAKELLKVCGFRQVRVWEQAEEVGFPDRADFLRFCSSAILRTLLSALSESQSARFLEEFAEAASTLLGGWRLDVIRQNLTALH